MAYMVTAKWTTKEGEEATVLDAIKKLPRLFVTNRGIDSIKWHAARRTRRWFFLFEIYANEDAYKAHGASQRFGKYGYGKATLVLESRERKFYQTIDP